MQRRILMDNIKNIGQISQNYLNIRSESAASAVREPAENSEIKTEETNGRQEERRNISDSAANGVYGSVLDVSEDGDTVSARPEALAALDDGIVMRKTETVSEQTSFVGISDSQMKTMYLKGEISNADYTKEIERRERLDEQLNSDDDDDTEAVQTQTQETLDRTNEFVNSMNDLQSASREDTIQNAAYDDAAKSGRTDIMMDIFNQGI